MVDVEGEEPRDPAAVRRREDQVWLREGTPGQSAVEPHAPGPSGGGEVGDPVLVDVAGDGDARHRQGLLEDGAEAALGEPRLHQAFRPHAEQALAAGLAVEADPVRPRRQPLRRRSDRLLEAEVDVPASLGAARQGRVELPLREDAAARLPVRPHEGLQVQAVDLAGPQQVAHDQRGRAQGLQAAGCRHLADPLPVVRHAGVEPVQPVLDGVQGVEGGLPLSGASGGHQQVRQQHQVLRRSLQGPLQGGHGLGEALLPQQGARPQVGGPRVPGMPGGEVFQHPAPQAGALRIVLQEPGEGMEHPRVVGIEPPGPLDLGQGPVLPP